MQIGNNGHCYICHRNYNPSDYNNPHTCAGTPTNCTSLNLDCQKWMTNKTDYNYCPHCGEKI